MQKDGDYWASKKAVTKVFYQGKMGMIKQNVPAN